MLGSLIKEAREARGWSQTQLAIRVRTSQQHVSRLEKGETEQPSPRLLMALARELGVPVERLLHALEPTAA